MQPRPRTAYQRKISVCVCVCVSHHILIWVHMFWHLTYVLTRCHVTDINNVLTRCHVTEINYVDRGAAARAPLQWSDCVVIYFFGVFCIQHHRRLWHHALKWPKFVSKFVSQRKFVSCCAFTLTMVQCISLKTLIFICASAITTQAPIDSPFANQNCVICIALSRRYRALCYRNDMW